MALDQWSKHAVVASLEYGELRPVTSFFNLVRAHNPGAAFSFLEGASGWQRWLFALIAVGVSGVLVAWLRRLPAGARLLPAALALIIGGALGNLVDRIRYGYVIDFIDFQATWENLPHHWPTFNVADIAICIGVALMALDMLSGKKLAPAPLPPAPSAPAHDLPPAA